MEFLTLSHLLRADIHDDFHFISTDMMVAIASFVASNTYEHSVEHLNPTHRYPFCGPTLKESTSC